MFHRLLIMKYRLLYRGLVRPVLFRLMSPQRAHEHILYLLRGADGNRLVQMLFRLIHRLYFVSDPVTIGGVRLDTPFILAAGFVKGEGFADEATALATVQAGRNIIPAWRSMPNLVGAVEFGSFTPHPRIGNAGNVLWRDVPTRSTQNRIGLKNPGAMAAAEFLAQHSLAPQTGINLAVSPGVSDPQQEQVEILTSLQSFLAKGIRPAWFTLNLSCPNTEVDPLGNQTEAKVLALCGAVTNLLKPYAISLWVKIGPDLSDEQYRRLMKAFQEVDVSAVIATNTLGQPVPDAPDVIAGVGGGRLHTEAVRVADLLMAEKQKHGYTVDVIGCGGVMDRATYADFCQVGVHVVQYWSALVYEGPLAAAMLKT